MKIKRKKQILCIVLFIVLFAVLCCFICPKVYFIIRYQHDEFYSFESYLSNHTIKVYRDLWYNGFAPGGGSDSPCIVKLIDNDTGKCLYVIRLEMIQNVKDIKIYPNSIFIGSETEWKY